MARRKSLIDTECQRTFIYPAQQENQGAHTGARILPGKFAPYLNFPPEALCCAEELRQELNLAA